MAFTKDTAELSQRAGRIFASLDKETKDKIRPEIEKASSFDDLPKWVQEIMIQTEKTNFIFK